MTLAIFFCGFPLPIGTARRMAPMLLLVILATVPPGYSQWSVRVGGPGSESVSDVGVDASGYVYLVGNFEGQLGLGGLSVTGSGDTPLFLARINPAGVPQWVRSVNGTPFPDTRMVVTPDGTTYLAGHFQGDITFGGDLFQGDSFELFFARYNIDGDPLGAFAGAGAGQKMVNGLGRSPTGDITLVGAFNGTVDLGGGTLRGVDGGTDFFLATYNSIGEHRRSTKYGGPAEDHPLDAALDANGTVYITGFFALGSGVVETDLGGGPLQGIDQEVFVASYNGTDAHRWSVAFGGPGDALGTALAVDADGNVYVGGTFEGTLTVGDATYRSRGAQDIFLVKYSPDGRLQWSQHGGGPGADAVTALTVGADGHVYATGSFEETVRFGTWTRTSAGATDVFLAKVQPDGTVEGLLRYGAGGSDQGRALAFDAAGDLLLAGTFEGNITLDGRLLTGVGGRDLFLTKLDAAFLRRVAIDASDPVPAASRLLPVFPNPALGRAWSTLHLATAQHVHLDAYDLLGRHVAVLHDGYLAPGTHWFTFEAATLPNGWYLLRAVGETFIASQPVLHVE